MLSLVCILAQLEGELGARGIVEQLSKDDVLEYKKLTITRMFIAFYCMLKCA